MGALFAYRGFDMETKEKIKVYADIVRGKTICMCVIGKKRCNKNCPQDAVERDKFAGWEQTFKRDRYGKSK